MCGISIAECELSQRCLRPPCEETRAGDLRAGQKPPDRLEVIQGISVPGLGGPDTAARETENGGDQ